MCWRLFLHLMRWSCVFSFSLFIWRIILTDFYTLNHSCISDETYLVRVNDFSDVLFVSVCQYFIEYFCINVHEGDWPVILFFSCIFMWLRYQGNCGLIKKNLAVFLLLVCISISFSMKFWLKPKPSGTGLFFFGLGGFWRLFLFP